MRKINLSSSGPVPVRKLDDSERMEKAAWFAAAGSMFAIAGIIISPESALDFARSMSAFRPSRGIRVKKIAKRIDRKKI
jgi:hypothetical protein